MNNLKSLRIEKGYTQLELAKKVGVTQRHIAFIESGDRDPSLELASKISKIFNATIDEVFFDN